MQKRAIGWGCCTLILAINCGPLVAQSEFRTALQQKYPNFRTVSCFTCHDRVPAGTENPKQYRNTFGKLFDEQLAGKQVTARLEAVDDLKRDDPEKKKVQEQVIEDVLEALKEIEKAPYPEGGTYGEALKEGKIEGIRIRR